MGTVANAVRWREASLAEERQRRQTAIKEYLQRLQDKVQPTCVVLFGSVAKGTDRVESDLDFVVVGGQLPKRLFDRLDVLAKLKWGIPVSIDVFPYTGSEFEGMLDNQHVTALDCMYEGIPLHGEAYFKRLHARFEELVKQGWHRTKCVWTNTPEKP